MPLHPLVAAASPGIAFAASLLATELVRRLSLRRGWLALPRRDRWHRRPVALLGGAGFIPAIVICAAAILVAAPGEELLRLPTAAAPDIRIFAGILLGTCIVFVLGLIDDLVGLGPGAKVIGQLVVASGTIAAGAVFPVAGSGVIDIVLTGLWIVGITNALNLLDNMDGLAAGAAGIAGTVLAVLSWRAGGTLGALLALTVAAAALGFWVHNRPPARIFMGDSGSLSLGYLLAALAIPSPLNNLFMTSTGATLAPPLLLALPATVLGLPILDTLLVTATRLWCSQRVFEGGRDHASHRLVALGLWEPRAVALLLATTAAGGLVALLLQHAPQTAAPVLIVYWFLLGLLGIHLGAVDGRVVGRPGEPSSWLLRVARAARRGNLLPVASDTALIVACFYGAYLLRFDSTLPPPLRAVVRETVPYVVVACLPAFYASGLYRLRWRFFGLGDVGVCLRAALAGSVLAITATAMVFRFGPGHSRSVYVIFAILLAIALAASRAGLRLLDALVRGMGPAKGPETRSVLIYGAGRGGRLLCDELRYDPRLRGHVPLGFVDDDPSLRGRRLCGLRIGTPADWRRRLGSPPDEVWVSSRTVSVERVERLRALWPDAAPVVRRAAVTIDPPPVRPAGGEPADAGRAA